MYIYIYYSALSFCVFSPHKMRQTSQKQHTVLRITENPCRECNLADFILIQNFANWKMLCLVLSMPKYNNSIIIVFKI